FRSTYRTPTALRSFPTRRSSDLLPGGALRALKVKVADGRERHRQVVQRGKQVAVRMLSRPGEADADPSLKISLVRHHHTSCSKRDRKSTRLNSSHVKISYAVFCL